MTHRILKSEIAPYPILPEAAKDAMTNLVQRYIDELQAWHDHHIIVRSQDDLTKPVRPEWQDFDGAKEPAAEFTAAMAKWESESKIWHDPYPEPLANEDIKASVKTTFKDDGEIIYEPDFEVVNDDPTPEEILRGAKDILISKVIELEHSAIEKNELPLGKRRIANMREVKINQDEQAKFAAEVATAGDGADHKTIMAKVIKQRSTDDATHLNEQEARRDKAEKVRELAASFMSDIEDLTLDTIGDFKLPSFD